MTLCFTAISFLFSCQWTFFGVDDGYVVVCCREGRVLGVLEVSRSIGDGQYKRCGVISTPDLRRCQLTANDRQEQDTGIHTKKQKKSCVSFWPPQVHHPGLWWLVQSFFCRWSRQIRLGHPSGTVRKSLLVLNLYCWCWVFYIYVKCNKSWTKHVGFIYFKDPWNLAKNTLKWLLQTEITYFLCLFSHGFLRLLCASLNF